MYRPRTCSVTRCARASSASSGRTCPRVTPARLAAAGAVMSGPGCRPSRRNSLAAASLRVRYDQENTVRMSLPGSASANASSV